MNEHPTSMTEPLTPQASPAKLNWSVPRHVALATAVFLLVQFMAVLGLRGVAAPELYPADFTKYIPVNTIEDDAALAITAVLNLFPSKNDRFSSLVHLGGPSLLIGRGLMRVAAYLGLVQIFDDPALYISYPKQLQKIWVIFGLYKLFVFLLWFPIVLYWIGRNHLSSRAGGVACWLLAVMPFVTGFEVRLKTDGPSIIAGLFALLFLFQYLKDYRRLTLAIGSGFLGLSLSMKFLLVPVGGILLAIIVHSWRTEGSNGKRLAARLGLSIASLLAVFAIANPFGVPGIIGFVKEILSSSIYLKYSHDMETPGFFAALWSQLGHADAFFGSWLGSVVPLVLASHLTTLLWRRDFFTPANLLLLCLVLNISYLAVVALPLLSTTYFFYLPSILILLLMSETISGLLTSSLYYGRGIFVLGFIVLAAIIGLTFKQDLAVLEYLRSPSNRQLAHAYIKNVAKPGDTVGIPVDPENETFSGFFGIDPFVYRLNKIGHHAERLTESASDWFLWFFPSPGSPSPVKNEAYAPVALFNAGRTLPHRHYDLYQELPFAVYAREGAEPAERHCDEEILYKLGDFIRKDPQQAFNIMQVQALPLRPLSLDLFRKAGQTVLPLPTQSFAQGLRDKSSPLVSVHQADRLTLAFWGIKYILCKVGDHAFAADTLNSRRFGLEKTGSLSGDVDIYRNLDYRGQALFLAATPPDETQSYTPPSRLLSWFRPVKNWGTLYPRAEIIRTASSALEITIRLETDGPVDILFKGGAYRRSILAGTGSQELVATYETGSGTEDAEFEIHPVTPGTSFTITAITTRPLRMDTGGAIAEVTSDPHFSFALARASAPGSVVFVQPYVDGLWRADVDGKPAAIRRGPANTVAVDVPAGEHLVSLMPKS